MISRTFLFGAIMSAVITSAHAAESIKWQTAAGAVTCPYYTSMAEAEASRKDPGWFADTGCVRQPAGIPLTIVQPPGGLAYMQVRLHSVSPETVWIGVYNAMGSFTAMGKKYGPLPYEKAQRASWEAYQKEHAKEIKAKADAQDAKIFAPLHAHYATQRTKFCAENPELARMTHEALLRSGNTQSKPCP
jgi:hypothetical protein